MNDQNKVTSLLLNYRISDDPKRKKLLEPALLALKPMLCKYCKYYFGFVSEDLIQDGYVELIRLINLYDDKHTDVPILGYLKRMTGWFYYSKKRKAAKNQDTECHLTDVMESIIGDEHNNIEEYDENDAVHSFLNTLNDKESEIVKRHILYEQPLVVVCKEMEISYSYGKKLKNSALKKMKTAL